MTEKPLPRGIRNNNPGNIERGKDKWLGLLPEQTDERFCQFVNPVMGLRALMIILRNYYNKHGLNSVRQIINRWAPPVENDTGSYQMAVAGALMVTPDTIIKLDNPMMLARLAAAIVLHENGRSSPKMPVAWYSDDVYFSAANMLFPRDMKA